METKTFDLKKQLLADYDTRWSKAGISGERLASRLGELSEIGLTANNGSRRPGFSYEEREAKNLVAGWMKEAGLLVRQDGAGNLIGRLEGRDKNAPILMSGSHVDTVPDGGHFDGTLGVLTALEVAQSWQETGYVPRKPYEIVVFSDEEGSRFNGGLTGSEAMMGDSDIEALKKRTDYDGRSFEEVLGDVGLSAKTFMEAKRPLEEIESFVEVHIEQGKRLEKEDLPCGIVTGIAGPCWLKVTFNGVAGHAGNTPMNDRQDALVAASRLIHKITHLPHKFSSSAVATVGNIEVKPNGTNVIPGEVTLYVDIRDIYEEPRQQLIDEIIATARYISASAEVSVDCRKVHSVAPVPVSQTLQADMEKAVTEVGLKPYFLPSGAGHDAMIIGHHLPSAMLFVRSKEGISHNPSEWSALNDCVQAAHILKHYLETAQNK